MSKANNKANGGEVIKMILSNPTTDLERELVESFGRYMSTAQSLTMNLAFAALFGSDEVDLSDNVFVDYLVDYTSTPDLSNKEARIKQLEEEYQLTTVEGIAIFNADSFTAKEAGDNALVNTVLERCGLKFNSTNISKLQDAFEATKRYTEGSPSFLNEFENREELCQKFIDFEQIFSARLESRKSKNK